jgi:hypothetical protein
MQPNLAEISLVLLGAPLKKSNNNRTRYASTNNDQKYWINMKFASNITICVEE